MMTDNWRAQPPPEPESGRVESSDRGLDECVAMLGHELRNALFPMQTSFQLLRLRGEHFPEQQRVERQLRHLTRIVDDLLDITRFSRGQISLQKRNVELAEVLQRAVDVAGPWMAQGPHRLDMRVPTRGCVLYADRERLAQVFSNLLINAVKYSPSGSKISVVAQSTLDHVTVAFRDEGVGISADMLDKVFDAFVQQPQTLLRARGGLGVGLTIVRKLVELHGGSVSVRSPGHDKGSEFCVRLPRAVKVTPDPPSSPDLPIPIKKGSRRVLVVDDDSDACDALGEALTRLGYRVSVSADGPSALRIVGSFQPDVALVDLGLPGIDGYELAPLLRQFRRPGAPFSIVALTGYTQRAARDRAAQAGFDEYLVKPVDLKTLQRVIESGCVKEGCAKETGKPAELLTSHR